MNVQQLLARYTTFRLETDLSVLSRKERQMLPLLIEAAQTMDGLFWRQTYGDREELLSRVGEGAVRRYVEINYGPWDRLNGNKPFVDGVGPKPPGANLYPKDMTKEEFEAALAASPEQANALKSLYTLVRRDATGRLVAAPYHESFTESLGHAAKKLREAAAVAEQPGLRRYLELRAQALETDDYQPSDMAWMDMKDNTLDIVIGPIETYEDALFGTRPRSNPTCSSKISTGAGGSPSTPLCSASCNARFPCRTNTNRKPREAIPISMSTTLSTTLGNATLRRRPSRSTFPTTKRSN
jgi:hypothetical protein